MEDRDLPPESGYVPDESLLPIPEMPEPVKRSRRLMDRMLPGLAKSWVPESLRDARLAPGHRAWVALLGVAAIAAVIAAVGVWWQRPAPRPVTAQVNGPPGAQVTDVRSGGPPPGGTDMTAQTSSNTANDSPTAQTSDDDRPIYVSVTGYVVNPGLVQLPPGSRVADALNAAGGLTSEGTLLGLNLAAKLHDGDAVVVGAAATAAAVPSGPSARDGPTANAKEPGQTSPVNLNTASESELDTLPGVGPATAAAIIAWRTENGPFASVDQLVNVPGIGSARLARLAPLVTV